MILISSWIILYFEMVNIKLINLNKKLEVARRKSYV